MSSDPPRNANLPPGYDEEDPYAGEDLSTYPDWWRRNIEEFREYDLRPYRPPRFEDQEYTPEIISQLEDELDVQIRLRGVDTEYEDDWEIWIDDTHVETIGRRREGGGFTIYEIDSDRFEDLVRSTTTETG